MDKYQIIKGPRKIQVAEVARLQEKDQLVLGDYDNDLILRTKGVITVQVQNKFYKIPLVDNLQSTEDDSSTGTTGVTVIDTLPAILTPFNTTLVYTSSDKTLYYIHNGEAVKLNNESSNQNNPLKFISYSESQTLTASDVITAQKNLDLYAGTDAELSGVLSNIVYSQEQSSFLYKNAAGSWVKLKSDFRLGGVIKGKVTISDTSTTLKTSMYLHGDGEAKGLLLENQFVNFKIYTSMYDAIIDSNTDIRIKDSTYIGDNKVTIGKPVDASETVAKLDVGGTTKTDILSSNTVRSINSTLNSNWSRNTGFTMTQGAEGSMLEIDSIRERKPDLHFIVDGIPATQFVEQCYYILDYYYDASGSAITHIELNTTQGLTNGDRLVSLAYNIENDSMYVNIIDVALHTTATNTITYTMTGNGTDQMSKLNIYGPLILIKNGQNKLALNPDTKSLEFYANIQKVNAGQSISDDIILEGFASTVDNVMASTFYERLNPRVQVRLKIHSRKLHTVVGDLSEVVDTGVGLNNTTNAIGLYSKNAYIRGRAALTNLTLGDKLTFNGTDLVLNPQVLIALLTAATPEQKTQIKTLLGL